MQNNTVPPDSVGYGGQLGNYTDTSVNLVLMGYRFYSPIYCRFLTRDPSGYEGGINLYAYCRNNPINRFDPLGLSDDEDDLDYKSLHPFASTYPGALKNINTGAKQALTGMKVVNSLSPATQAFEVISGKRAAEVNQKISNSERILMGGLGLLGLGANPLPKIVRGKWITDLTEAEIKVLKGKIFADISKTEIGLLAEWFGPNEKGALLAIINKTKPPAGLSEKAIRAYRDTARLSIGLERDSRGSQRLRLKLCDDALRHMERARAK